MAKKSTNKEDATRLGISKREIDMFAGVLERRTKSCLLYTSTIAKGAIRLFGQPLSYFTIVRNTESTSCTYPSFINSFILDSLSKKQSTSLQPDSHIPEYLHISLINTYRNPNTHPKKSQCNHLIPTENIRSFSFPPVILIIGRKENKRRTIAGRR